MKPTFWGLVGVMLLAGIQSVPAQAGPDLDTLMQAIRQAQLNAVKLQRVFVQEGYETDAEFTARKAAALALSSAPEAVALQSAINALESTVFTVTPDKVTIQARPFNREAKSWTFNLISQDSTVPYRGNVVWSITGSANMKAAFDPVDAAINNETLVASIEYRIEVLGVGRFQIYGLNACFTSEGHELFRIPLQGVWIFTEETRTNPDFYQSRRPVTTAIRGSEAGNSYDIVMDAIPGTGGRSLYNPIWLYMPLPYELPNAIYTAIPDRSGYPGTAAQRREQFAGVYELVSGTWRLKRGSMPGSQPDYEARPPVWVMLQDAGYDVAKAEYKTMNRLREVTILFKVSPYHPDRGVTLETIHIERSSGISFVDDAVIYAFSKSQFSNSGDSSINGRLNYRF